MQRNLSTHAQVLYRTFGRFSSGISKVSGIFGGIAFLNYIVPTGAACIPDANYQPIPGLGHVCVLDNLGNPIQLDVNLIEGLQTTVKAAISKCALTIANQELCDPNLTTKGRCLIASIVDQSGTILGYLTYLTDGVKSYNPIQVDCFMNMVNATLFPNPTTLAPTTMLPTTVVTTSLAPTASPTTTPGHTLPAPTHNPNPARFFIEIAFAGVLGIAFLVVLYKCIGSWCRTSNRAQAPRQRNLELGNAAADERSRLLPPPAYNEAVAKNVREAYEGGNVGKLLNDVDDSSPAARRVNG